MRKVIIYVHEESNKIVSKVCDGCGGIKLTEDFRKRGTHMDFISLCVNCENNKEVSA